jgi:Transport and Golgi organisation 2
MLAKKPAEYNINGTKLMYPKDANASGTWIAVKENGSTVCLLNGAFEAHTPQPPYRRSRGLVVLDIASENNMTDAFQNADLYRVEPFTMIIAEQHTLYECRWDGSQKFVMQLNENQPHIWSSSTLYPLATRLKRKQWFEVWQAALPKPTVTDILNFHVQTGDGDIQNDLVMNRSNEVFTVSVTSVLAEGATINMQYFDLKENDITNTAFGQNIQSS